MIMMIVRSTIVVQTSVDVDSALFLLFTVRSFPPSFWLILLTNLLLKNSALNGVQGSEDFHFGKGRFVFLFRASYYQYFFTE